MIYGKQTPALADDLGITIEEAQERVDKFFETKPNVEKFINDTHAFVEENGYVTTLNGFRRNLTGIVSSDYGTRSKALRQSVNTIIQGSGAILTNTSLIILNKALKQLHLRSVIAATVHDSILMDCPEDEIPKVAKLALGIMTNLPYSWLMYNHNGKKERYPIEAEVDIGANYNDEVDYDPELINQLGYDKYLEYKIKLKRISDAEESEVLTKEQRAFLEKKVTAEYLK